jgi:hypothetical protein
VPLRDHRLMRLARQFDPLRQTCKRCTFVSLAERVLGVMFNSMDTRAGYAVFRIRLPRLPLTKSFDELRPLRIPGS